MTEDIWVNDKAGNNKKAFYVKKHNPEIYEKIMDYAKQNEFEFFSFFEKCYYFRYKKLPLVQNGKKQIFRGFSKGISVNFLEDVNELKLNYYKFDSKKYIEKIFEKFSGIEDDAGKISQLIQCHDRFEEIIKELEKKTSFLDDLNPSLRHRIYALKHGISEIPRCRCGKQVKLQDVRGNFCNSCGDKQCYHILWNCSGKRKPFTLPSGLVIKTQGFENLVLKELLTLYKEDDLLIDDFEIRKHIGTISYKTADGKIRKYLPDIYIKSENLIVEVKSDWTFNKRGMIEDYENTSLLKSFAVIKQKINFMFWIFRTDGKTEKIIMKYE